MACSIYISLQPELILRGSFEERAAVDEYIKQVGQPAVILQLGSFSENMLNSQRPRPSSTEPSTFDLVYPVVRPQVPVPHTWIECDLGHVACAVVDNWEDAGARAKLTQKKAFQYVRSVLQGRKRWRPSNVSLARH